MNNLIWLLDFTIPLMMILIGYFLYKKQPKNINYVLGYRTKRSMSSKENWIYANKRMGEIWFKVGWGLLILILLFRLLLPLKSEDITEISSILGLIIMFAPIFVVEKELKKMNN